MVARLAMVAIAGFLAAGAALAQSNSSQDRMAKMDRHFSYTDKNSDGYIARDEAAHYPALIKYFGVIDSNSDKKLSRGEMQAYRLGTHKKSRASNSAQTKMAEDEGDSPLTKSDADDSTSHRKSN